MVGLLVVELSWSEGQHHLLEVPWVELIEVEVGFAVASCRVGSLVVEQTSMAALVVVGRPHFYPEHLD
jgi:hypothetical protein